jgi:hypothetical protein
MSKNYRAIYEGKNYVIAKKTLEKYTIIDKKDGSILNEIEYYNGSKTDEDNIWIFKGVDPRYCGIILMNNIMGGVKYTVYNGNLMQRIVDCKGGWEDLAIVPPDKTKRSEYIIARVWNIHADRKINLAGFTDGNISNNLAVRFAHEIDMIRLVRKGKSIYLVGSDRNMHRNYTIKILESIEGYNCWLDREPEILDNDIDSEVLNWEEYERMDRIK